MDLSKDMIVSEKDTLSKKVKWYLITFFCEGAILILLGGVLPLWGIASYNKILGGILFFPSFLLAGKLCFMLENRIGIACCLQNPNRKNLVQLPTLYPTWMRSVNGEKQKKDKNN